MEAPSHLWSEVDARAIVAILNEELGADLDEQTISFLTYGGTGVHFPGYSPDYSRGESSLSCHGFDLAAKHDGNPCSVSSRASSSTVKGLERERRANERLTDLHWRRNVRQAAGPRKRPSVLAGS